MKTMTNEELTEAIAIIVKVVNADPFADAELMVAMSDFIKLSDKLWTANKKRI